MNKLRGVAFKYVWFILAIIGELFYALALLKPFRSVIILYTYCFILSTKYWRYFN